MTMDIQSLLDASPAVVLVFVLNFIGYAVKKIPALPDWIIPFLLPAIGAVSYVFVGELSAKIAAAKYPTAILALYGAGIGCAAVGLNQALRQWTGRGTLGDDDVIKKD